MPAVSDEKWISGVESQRGEFLGEQLEADTGDRVVDSLYDSCLQYS
jgi:hypothetical protein